jgi:glycerophosphoryl diester phosphodiesterase family protein
MTARPPFDPETDDPSRWVSGPPWILGRRGAPLEAPENTLASLRRAMELGADGCAYELRSTADGELVLLADPTLERTSDAHGPLATRTLPELFGVDAGGWFGKRFHGEPLALLEEALALEGNHAGSHPQHWIELCEPGLVGDLARVLRGWGERLSVRVASASRDVCVEARDAGLNAMLLGRVAGEDERRFVRDERLFAFGTTATGWRGAPGEWSCERWMLRVDGPGELFQACRGGFNGVTTHELERALAVRALAALAPEAGEHPLAVPELVVEHDSSLPGAGEWCGHWPILARVSNPFAERARVELSLRVRRGAFEAHGLPATIELAPGEAFERELTLTGGSWSPGADPLLVASFQRLGGPWRQRPPLALDAPLRRIRRLAIGASAQRVPMLREHPGQREATMTLQRQGHWLLVALENAGGLSGAQALVHLDGETFQGGRALRLALPEDLESRTAGIPFSVGMAGREGAQIRLRRWCGGLPDELSGGSPGLLLARGAG